MSGQGSLGVPFAVRCVLAGCLSFLLHLFISFHTIQEILTAGAVLDVFNTNRHTFGKDSAFDALVHNNADSVLGDVENAASLAVVGLMRHTFLESTISLQESTI